MTNILDELFLTEKDNELIIRNNEKIVFNDQQYLGIQKIRNWHTYSDSPTFTLAGYAGTGKTTCIKKIINEYRKPIVISAPTHKAKRVAANISDRPAETLHSLLGLRPNIDLDDFNPNNPIFNPIAPPKINNYSLVIIDESSMINKELYDLIHMLVNNTQTKVLFIGDPAQIPPVNEEESNIFVVGNDNVHWLTKIERQKEGNPLLNVYTDLRNNLLSNSGGYERQTNINGKGEGVYFLKDKNKFKTKILEKFSSSEFQNNINYCRLITWRNTVVFSSNQVIRNNIFENSGDFLLLKGDVLMGYRTIVTNNMQDNIIENSLDYRVQHVDKKTKNKYGIFGYNATLKEEFGLNSFGWTRDVFIIDIRDENNLHNFAEKHDALKEEAKANKTKWKKYYTFRRNNILMKSINVYRNGRNRETENIITKDLDYGYSMTCHKSQGSTFNHVCIIENDINFNPKTKERNQIKYVSFTRPTTSAIVMTTQLK